MSRTIDERVVRFEFDNAEFERNVKTSMSTLDKLEKSLKFDGAEKGFEKIEEAAARTDLNPIFKATVTVSEGFSSLERIAINVLSSIAIRAEQAGERLIRSLSTDQLQEGYGKYEQKISSVQTLVNATGKSVEEINDYLATLMRFSDETSYGFTEMASSLGQLASSGGDVEKLIPMIMGVANATAFAGKQSAEFSRAIYNLNQSYGSGALKYMDWKSLELAGVASKQLKESFIETAIELGTLTKAGALANGELVTIANFGQTLKENWATTEVMEQTFGKFYQYTQKADEMVAQGIAATYTEAYRKMVKENNDLLQDAYFRAAKAAQEATTFNQAIIATKDAVSSGWMNMFDILFGDYDQAKKTWSNLAEDFYTIFAEPGNARNDILGGAFKNGYAQVKELFTSAGIDFNNYSDRFEKFLDSNGYNVDALIKKYGSLGEAIANNASVASWYTGKYTNVGSLFANFTDDFIHSVDGMTIASEDAEDVLERVQKIFDGIWAGDYGTGETRIKKLTEASIDFATAQKLINDLAAEGHKSGYKLTIEDIEKLTDEEKKNLGITESEAEAIKQLNEMMGEAGISIDDLRRKLTRKSGQVLLSETISNVTQSIIALQEIASTAWANIFDIDFSEVIYKALEKVESFTRGVKESITENERLLKIFETVFKVLQLVGKGFSFVYEIVKQLVKAGLNVLNKIFGDLNLNIDGFIDKLSEGLDKAIEWISDNEVIVSTIDSIVTHVTNAIDKVSEWIGSIVDLKQVSTIFDDVKKSAEKLFTGDFLSNNIFTKTIDDLKTTVEGITSGTINPFDNFAETLNTFVGNTQDSLKAFKDNLDTNLTTTLEKLNIDADKIAFFREKIGALSETLIGLAGMYLTLTTFKKFAEAAASLMKPFVALSDLIGSARGVFTSISGYIKASQASININNILKIAVAVGIIAGAMYALAKVGQEGELWTAIKATGMLLAMIAGFAWVLSTLGNSKSGNGEKAKANIKEMAMLILSLGAAMLLIAGAMKVMDSVQHGLSALLGVIILLIAVVFATNQLNRNVNVASLFDLIGIALALRILAGALVKLDQLQLRNPGKIIGIIAGTVVAMSVLAAAAKGVNGSSYKILLSFVGSLYLLTKVMDKYNEMSDVDYVKGLLRMIPIIGALIAIMALSKGLSKESAGFSALLMIGAATSVLLLGQAIEKLGKLNTDELIQGGIAASILYAVVGGLGSLMARLANVKGATIKSAIGASILMVTAAASLYIMAGAIMIFKNMDKEGLWHAVGAIGVLFVALGTMMWMIGESGLFGKDAQAYQAVNAFGKIAILIAVLAGSIAVLTGLAIYNPTAFIAAVASMITIIGAVALLMGVLSLYKNPWKDLSAGVLAIVGIIGTIGVALTILTNEITNTEKALSIAKALSDIMVALGEVLVLAAVASKLSVGLAASGKIMMVMSIITGIVIALAGVIAACEESGILDGNKVDAVLDRMIEILTKVGEALGSLVGGVFSGATEQLMVAAENMKKVGESLKAFGTLAFPETFNDTVESLKNLIIAVGTNSDNIKKIAKLSDKVGDIKNFFTGFGTALVAFSTSMDGVDTEKIQAGADAGTMFASLNDSIGDNGIFGRIKESKNWDTFKSNMEKFGDGLTTFSTKLDGFNRFLVENNLPTIQKLMDLEQNMNSSSSLWGWIAGTTKSLGDFGTRAAEFGTGLVSFSNSMIRFNPNSVDKAVKAGEALDALEKAVNVSWNVMGFLTGGENGNQSLGDFGKRIKAFAENMVEGLNAFADLGANKNIGIVTKPLAPLSEENGVNMWKKVEMTVDRMISVANKFKELEDSLTIEGGSIFGGKSNIENFGKGIKSFSTDFKAFVDNLPDTMPDGTVIQSMIDISEMLLGFQTANNESMGQSEGILSSLGASVEGAGNFISSMFANLANFDITSFSEEGGLFEKIRNIFANEDIIEGVSEDGVTVSTGYLQAMEETFTDSDPLKKLKKAMSDTVDDLVNTFVVNDHEGHKRSYEAVFYEIGENYMKGLLEGIESMVPAIVKRCSEIAEMVSSAIAGAWQERSPSKVAFGLGRYFTMGLVNGIDSYTDAAIDNAETMANDVLEAVRYAMAAETSVLEDELSPLITPVLDASGVMQGASSINSLLGASHYYDAALGISALRSGMLNDQNGSFGNNITVNATFEINGNTNIDDPMVARDFARKIANEINVILGTSV